MALFFPDDEIIDNIPKTEIHAFNLTFCFVCRTGLILNLSDRLCRRDRCSAGLSEPRTVVLEISLLSLGKCRFFWGEIGKRVKLLKLWISSTWLGPISDELQVSQLLLPQSPARPLVQYADDITHLSIRGHSIFPKKRCSRRPGHNSALIIIVNHGAAAAIRRRAFMKINLSRRRTGVITERDSERG